MVWIGFRSGVVAHDWDTVKRHTRGFLIHVFRFLCSVFFKVSFLICVWRKSLDDFSNGLKWGSSASHILRFSVWTCEKIDDYSASSHLWEMGNLISNNLVSITKSFVGSPETGLRGIFDILIICLSFFLSPALFVTSQLNSVTDRAGSFLTVLHYTAFMPFSAWNKLMG